MGHILEPLAKILGPMLKDGTINSITAKITGEKRGVPEGVWVAGWNFLANTLFAEVKKSRSECRANCVKDNKLQPFNPTSL